MRGVAQCASRLSCHHLRVDSGDARAHVREIRVHCRVWIVVVLDDVLRELVHRQRGLGDRETAGGAGPFEALLGVAGAVGPQILCNVTIER